ncbi:MAG: ABC transporter ATP-binding protein [Rhizobiales bacterium]|nr:ABC transporter ATP-binding protein [Hyphomicrobiales bacterium]
MSGLVLRDVEVRAGGRAIVADASLAAPKGRVTGLLGPNGAGKSTLLAATLGLRRLAQGSVHFDGLDLAAMPAAERARLAAYVEQSAATSERLTVRDVVALGRIPYQSVWQSGPGAGDEAIVASALAALGVTGFGDRLYQTLSGGEQQRVQIARALAQEPTLLLLDEPTSHLDIEAQLTTLDLLRERAQAGCTIILAMHDLNLAARHCDHLAVMKDGRVVAEGAPAAVLSAPLLLDVYGVHATIVQLPGHGAPLVVYDRARGSGAGPDSG